VLQTVINIFGGIFILTVMVLKGYVIITMYFITSYWMS